MSCPTILDQMRMLREAKRAFRAAHALHLHPWRRLMRDRDSRLGKDYMVELTRELELRVVDHQTGVIVAQTAPLAFGPLLPVPVEVE